MTFSPIANGIIITLILLILILSSLLWRTWRQLKNAIIVLEDIQAGNNQRRIIVSQGNLAMDVCFKINEIVAQYKKELEKHKEGEYSYKQLITSLSHDIRTPLTGLIGYLEAVNTGIVDAAEKEAYLLVVSRKAQELRVYLDTLFEYLKLESGDRTFHMEPIDLCILLRQYMADWIPRLEAHGFTYKIHIPAYPVVIRGEGASIKRIFDNLVQNVIHHSGGDILVVGLEVYLQGIRLWIEDNGQGIPPKDLPYVFDRLYRGDKSRSSTGSGLGLAIVWELVKAHGGRLTAVKVQPHGTRFLAVFPLSQ